MKIEEDLKESNIIKMWLLDSRKEEEKIIITQKYDWLILFDIINSLVLGDKYWFVFFGYIIRL